MLRCCCAEGHAIHSSEGPHQEEDSLEELEEVVANLKEQCNSVRTSSEPLLPLSSSRRSQASEDSPYQAA